MTLAFSRIRTYEISGMYFLKSSVFVSTTKKLLSHLKILENKGNNLSLWGIAWMSFFWSTSSLMVFSILPAFLTDVLKASHSKIGYIEGVAVFISFVAKVFSGTLSDYVKNRKYLIIIGTIFSVIIKPMFAIAASINMIFSARFIDRISKGIRSAPTDALIADLAPKKDLGSAYGTRQSLYTFGGMFGAFVASMLMLYTNHDYRLIFYLSTIPALIALGILIFIVKQPPILENGKRIDWHISHIRLLPPKFWALLGVVAILMLARFSEAFVTLRAKESGWGVAYLPWIIVMMDIFHASMAFPMGRISDKINRYKLLLIGLTITVLAHTAMIIDGHWSVVCVGVVLIGLYLGVTQGLLSTLISENTPPHLRGTAFALYYLTAGTSVLIGNVCAGKLSDHFGLVGAFYGGGSVTILAILVLFVLMHFFGKPSPSSAPPVSE